MHVHLLYALLSPATHPLIHTNPSLQVYHRATIILFGRARVQHLTYLLAYVLACRYNILQLFGRVPYNTCRNFEWQMCAAKGFLGSQASKRMVFAHAPKDVWMDGWPPFDQCHGFTDTGGCNRWTQFANDDIYPLEVCLFSQVCKNDDELFSIEAGQPFVCEIDVPGFRYLQAMLMDGPRHFSA